MKKLLKQLIIDTATKYIFLSLVIDGVEKQHFYEVGINNHSVTIIPYLKTMLENEKIKLQEIDEIIVGVGPGSYTGVRIGVTVAKMIAYLNNLSLYKVSSLALMASSSNKPYVLALIDARRGNAFMGLYANSGEKLNIVKADCLQNIEKFKTSLEINFEVVEEGKPDVNKILKSDLLTKVDDVHSLTPNYLQVTEAERNLRNEN
ncbi:MAG: tRNA (adenosine(37)-N6)-threonylcarbamoyltransferase complex dimerization subunit type 1 TsaB [Tenericutes bacterium HGW-Tenericutes-5]|nr:MAG: tRNA (adenosine(37)-N6)-threonylcarbamoyltransferase complex dimerization subunit type 1 TsaB [Tenericutes bacterium HGW-Tenericutes-5]